MTVLNLGINDWAAGTTASTYSGYMQTLITNALSTGDCILQTPFPSSTTVATTTLQQSYVTALYTLAQTNNIPLIDIWSRFVSNANALTMGLDYDTKHPNGAGYAEIAAAHVHVMQSP